MSEQDWMSPDAAAEYLGLSRQQLYRGYVNRGRIERRHNPEVNRTWLRRADVERVKASREAGPDEIEEG